jgi:hypothetical protein
VLSQIERKLSGPKAQLLSTYVNQVLGDRWFLGAGVIFAVLNFLIGFRFGLPLDYRGSWTAEAFTYGGFLLVGFVCGIPVAGIFGVWRVFKKFAKEDAPSTFDYEAEDNCGGTQFIGEAFVKFACVTLIEGVLIAWYISNMKWTRSDELFVIVISRAWIFWPFVCSILVLIGPAIAMHQALEEWKQKEVKDIQKKIKATEERIEKSTHPETESLLKLYEHYTGHRKALYEMRTWPYDLTSKINYLVVFLCSALAQAAGAQDNLKKLGEFIKKH